MNDLSHTNASGFTLVEVLVATTILTIVGTSAALLTSSAITATARARTDTTMVGLASERIEQLRGLTFGFGSAHVPAPATDITTDLSGRAPSPGGPGLLEAPSALDSDTAGYVDHADGQGRWLGAGVGGAAGARFSRRWSVARAPGSIDTLVLQVRVIDRSGLVRDVHLYTLKTRTGG